MTTPYSDVMVTSVTCWYDVLVWGKWKNFGWWCYSAICPYRCAKKIVHRIGSHIVHKWEWYDLSSPIVQYVRVCHQMGSRVVQLYGMNPHMDMLVLFIVNNLSSLFPLPYIMKSYDIVPKFHVCKHILSTYYKWFLVESIFNIFIFKLNEYNMDVHLCFDSTVLI